VKSAVDSSQSNFTNEASPLELTFRDPAGQLRLTATHALRRIHPSAEDAVHDFLASPLRVALERSGDLIASSVAAPSRHACIRGGELWLEHPRVDPISYPWEWTAAQWRAAAELTLRVAAQAIDAGWTLKDATPLNVLFAGGRPVLVDVLSLERRDPHSSVWLAYGQFVRTFLLPLVAAKHLKWPLQATLFWRDGYEPTAIARALPLRQLLHPRLLDVVTMASMFEASSGSRSGTGDGKGGKQNKARRLSSARDPELAHHILRKRIARLEKQIAYAAPGQSRSQWSEYTQSASHYGAADVEAKQQFVRGVLDRYLPARVLDIGANTGSYSMIAAEAGAQVVALDNDEAAIDALWRTAAERGLPITALVANIARPTPAAGWRNREHLSLLDRLADRPGGQLDGGFDLVLMLAVIHHLILREQVPLPLIGELCASLTRRWLVVEWVPPSDPMYQEWLRGRDDLYGHLSETDLMRALAPFFHMRQHAVLGNQRVLLLFERAEDASAELQVQSPGAAPA
jgi:SAM-dependent methyltransferase